MKRAVLVVAAATLSAGAAADVSGFVQLRQVQRLHSQSACAVEGCTAMAQESLGELLVEQRLGERLSASLRIEAGYDNAIATAKVAAREAFVDWTPAPQLDVKVGRQVLTWGVSEYLYVNDIFPKNYDAFFTGAGFDRMKEPVDAARLAWHSSAADWEVVFSRAKADRMPSPDRFVATAAAAAIPAEDDDGSLDAALKVTRNVGGWDLAAYAASFRSREQRYVAGPTGLRSDRPRLRHLGFSVSGNAAGGVAWFEAAIRHASDGTHDIASRQFFGSSGKAIVGYSREIALDLTASAQVQIEAPLNRQRYVASLLPGVRPAPAIARTLHLRLQGRWMNQTLTGGAQFFAGSEGDTHLNPFLNWSPADGWTLEAGANFFHGKRDTRYGALTDDSNVYLAGRYSF